MARGFEEACIFRVRGLKRGEFECIDPDAMHRFFVIAPVGTAHGKPAFGNAPHDGLEKFAVPEIWGRHEYAIFSSFLKNLKRCHSVFVAPHGV